MRRPAASSCTDPRRSSGWMGIPSCSQCTSFDVLLAQSVSEFFLDGGVPQMDQQIAAMYEEMHFSRHCKDRSTTSRPNHWDMVNNCHNFKLVRGELREWSEFSTKLCSQVAAGDGGVVTLLLRVETVMPESHAEEKDLCG